ncbi:MAG: hypothetical protein WD669_07800 [Pirellulales bacterium]
MTKTLEQAIERLRQMPEDRQDSLAQLLLHEIEEDERWQKSTESHADRLQGLVRDVLEADRRGECEPLHPDQL